MMSLTLDDLADLPPAVGLQTAAAALGLGRTKAYALAQRDEFPCRILKIGNSYRVPTADLLRYLGVPPRPTTDQPR